MHQVIDKELDDMVAKSFGWKEGDTFVRYPRENYVYHSYHPSTNSGQAVELVKEFKLALMYVEYHEGKLCKPYWRAMWTSPIDSMHYSRYADDERLEVAVCKAVLEIQKPHIYSRDTNE